MRTTFGSRVGALTLVLSGLVVPGDVGRADIDTDSHPSEIARLADRSLLLDVELIGDHFVAVGERGHILWSSDGATWTQVAAPTRRMLTAIAAHGNTVWAVGHDAIILRSDDGGRTWRRVFSAPDDESPLFDVWTDGARVIAAGAYGLTLISDDGETFDYSVIGDGEEEEDFHIYALSSADDGELFAAGEFGRVLLSTDRGDSWTRLEAPYEGTFFGVFALGEGGVLLYGLRGNCYRSHDLGATWRRIETHTTAGLLSAVRLPDTRILLVGLSGAMLVSMDDGRSFFDHSRLDRIALTDVAPVDDSTWLLLGESGVQLVDAFGVR